LIAGPPNVPRDSETSWVPTMAMISMDTVAAPPGRSGGTIPIAAGDRPPSRQSF
jgi:hypothetical protein